MRTDRLNVARVPVFAAAVLLVGLLAAAPARAHHHSGGPVCVGAPPPRNMDGPPEEKGFWEDIVDLGEEAVHAIHLPLTGKILLWGWNAPGNIGKVYDPETGISTDIVMPVPAFCSGHTHLADGRVMIAGGLGRVPSRSSTVFDPITMTFAPPVPMNGGRFYPTITLLEDGRVFTASGTGSGSSVPEIWDPDTNVWTQLGCIPNGPCRNATIRMHWFPRTAVGLDGQLFLLPASRSLVPQSFDVDTETWTPHPIGSLPGGKVSPAPAVYYAPGKILRAGTDVYAPKTKATGEATIVDITDIQNPTISSTNPMIYARNRGTLTLLADGTVLVSGGIREADCDPPANDPNVYYPEIWDPATEQWQALGPMQVARVYHSTAILLRDGSVLSAGGEPHQRSSQIFRPPYLFKGPRPTITSAPGTIQVGQSFEVFTPDAPSIAQVNLLKLGAVTHAYDQSQHIVRLNFVAGVDRVTVDGPTSSYDALPGYYMLFLVSDLGVPSIAEYVMVPAEEEW